MEEKIVKSVCRICAGGCGVNVHVRNGKIIKVEGMPEDPRTLGALCPKGLAATQLVYSPDRLKYPMKRVGEEGDGKFVRITWIEALNTITEKLKEIKENYGAKAVSVYRGQASDWGSAWLYVLRFMNVFGSPNVCTPAHLCFHPRRLGAILTYGVRMQPDYENTECIILWGSNPPGTAESGLNVRQIFDAKERDAKLIVIDPLLTSLASKADIWAQIRPGTDCALALAMLNVIVNEKLYDKDFVHKWTYGFDKLRDHVQAFPPEQVEKITRVKADTIKEIARTYATHKPACIYDGNGVDQYINCVQTVRAICILRAITGNLDIPGGDLIPDAIPTVDITLNERLPKEVKSAGEYTLFQQIAMQIPPPPIIDAILTGEPYPIKAMIVQGGNPTVTPANSTKVREALRRLDLLVVMDLFNTRTAALADIVLPAATSFEKTGLTAYPALRTNFVLLQQKVIEPLGESWPDWKFWFELARKMGYHEEFPWEDVEEAIDEQIRPSGLTVTKLKEGPVFLPRHYRKFEDKGFPLTSSGKIQIYSETLKSYGFEPLPTYIESPESPVSKPDLLRNYPLMGTCWPRSVYVHTQYRNVPWLRALDPEPLVRMCPNDANERDVKDGDTVVIRSPRGQIKVKTKVTHRVPPGLVAFSWGWGETIPEAELNKLTDDMVRDPITGTTANRLFLCEVKKA